MAKKDWWMRCILYMFTILIMGAIFVICMTKVDNNWIAGIITGVVYIAIIVINVIYYLKEKNNNIKFSIPDKEWKKIIKDSKD